MSFTSTLLIFNTEEFVPSDDTEYLLLPESCREPLNHSTAGKGSPLKAHKKVAFFVPADDVELYSMVMLFGDVVTAGAVEKFSPGINIENYSQRKTVATRNSANWLDLFSSNIIF